MLYFPTFSRFAAVFEYDGKRDHPQCLSLELGERVYIYEECDGWYRGCSTSKQHIKVGLIVLSRSTVNCFSTL